MAAPSFPDDPAFKCLRVGDLNGYHEAISNRQIVDFSGVDLRGTDFRKADLSKVILRNTYLKDADLRGCDLRHVDLEGTSLRNAKVSGAYFSDNLSPGELRLSIDLGTRLRTGPAGIEQ